MTHLHILLIHFGEHGARAELLQTVHDSGDLAPPAFVAVLALNGFCDMEKPSGAPVNEALR